MKTYLSSLFAGLAISVLGVSQADAQYWGGGGHTIHQDVIHGDHVDHIHHRYIPSHGHYHSEIVGSRPLYGCHYGSYDAGYYSGLGFGVSGYSSSRTSGLHWSSLYRGGYYGGNISPHRYGAHYHHH
jgi:hypothetical protein